MATAKPIFRPAGPADVEALIGLYDRHYRGGYSACFDRYGPVTPQDLWWVQSEKDVTVVEVNRRLAAMVILGRAGKRLLAEEALVEAVPDDAAAFLRQLHEWLTRRFQEERQDALTLRCDETNAAALTIARTFGFTFANALLVAGGAPTSGREGDPASPPGYHIRRAAPADSRHLARLHDETLGHPLRPKDLDGLWRQADTRVMVAERERFPVGFLIAQVRDGAGRWTIGIREAHRRRGLGRALVHAAQQFFHAKRVPAVTIYWGTDTAAAAFVHALGARTERAYLYFERAL